MVTKERGENIVASKKSHISDFRGDDDEAVSKEEMDFETVHNIDEWGVESVSVIFANYDSTYN